MVGDEEAAHYLTTTIVRARIGARELAEQSGVALAHLAAVDAGREPLTATDVVDLADALDCPPEWLAGGWPALVGE